MCTPQKSIESFKEDVDRKVGEFLKSTNVCRDPVKDYDLILVEDDNELKQLSDNDKYDFIGYLNAKYKINMTLVSFTEYKEILKTDSGLRENMLMLKPVFISANDIILRAN